MFRGISRELISRVIAEECVYYKIALAETEVNVYEEASSKTGRFYYTGVLLNCLRETDPQDTKDGDPGPDQSQQIRFRFLRDDMVDINLLPQNGDILMWKNEYFEVDNWVENQMVLGKDPNYALSAETQGFGASWSIIVYTHHTRPTKLNITKDRL